ncbi:alkaline phosphatase family protein [Nocardioides montaniterrae]
MVRRLGIALAMATLLTGCGSAPHASGEARQASAPTAPRVAGSVSKVLVFVVENHSMAEMRAGMPWVYRLAKRYGHTTAYHAVTHPSLPNYLAMAGGSTFGIRDDLSPASHPLSGRSVFGRTLAAGRRAKVYAESMPTTCALDPSGRYAVKHNAWAYFTAARRGCRRFDVPLKAYAADVTNGRLPNVGFVIPNLCSDAHDCSLSVADSWLKAKVGRALAGPDFTSGRLAIVITADEDDHSDGNRILTVVAHRSLNGKVVSTPLNHYGLSRSLSQVSHTAPLRKARNATSVLRAFGLTLG